MYGEPSVEGSQTVVEPLESRSDCPVPSGAPGCSAAIGLVVIRRSPANTVADLTIGNMDLRLLTFLSSLGVLSDYFGAGRRKGQEGLLACGHADDERVESPPVEQGSKRTESHGLRDDGNHRENDQPKVNPEAPVVDEGQRKSTLPGANNLVVKEIGVGTALQDFAFVGEDNGSRVCNPRRHGKHAFLRIRVKRSVAQHLGPRSDHAHFTL